MGGEFLIFFLKVIELFPAVLCCLCAGVCIFKAPSCFLGVGTSVLGHVSLGQQIPSLMEAWVLSACEISSQNYFRHSFEANVSISVYFLPTYKSVLVNIWRVCYHWERRGVKYLEWSRYKCCLLWMQPCSRGHIWWWDLPEWCSA